MQRFVTYALIEWPSFKQNNCHNSLHLNFTALELHSPVMTPVTSARNRHPHHLPRRPISKSHAESRTLQRAAEAHTYHGTPRATGSVVTYSAFLSLRFEPLVNPHSVLRPDKDACSAVIRASAEQWQHQMSRLPMTVLHPGRKVCKHTHLVKLVKVLRR
jgi:hypothetical protein